MNQRVQIVCFEAPVMCMGIDFIAESTPVAMYFMHVTLKFYPTSLRPLPCHSGTYGVPLSNLDQQAAIIIKARVLHPSQTDSRSYHEI